MTYDQSYSGSYLIPLVLVETLPHKVAHSPEALVLRNLVLLKGKSMPGNIHPLSLVFIFGATELAHSFFTQ